MKDIKQILNPWGPKVAPTHKIVEYIPPRFDENNPQRIVVINGSGGCGKDTFVELCSNFVRVRNYSSIDAIKNLAMKYFEWDGSKDARDRLFLSDLKKLTETYCDFSTKDICKQVEKFYKEKTDNIIFLHIREAEMIDKFKKYYPEAITLLIENPRVEIIESNNSDALVGYYDYDCTILNDGTIEDLKSKAQDFVTWVLDPQEDTTK